MNKEDALAAFCRKNKIDFEKVQNIADDNYAPQIAALPERLDYWLSGMAEEDHDVFLTLFSHYTYLTPAQCRLRYRTILDLLEKELEYLKINWWETLFVSIEADDAYASGGDNVRSDLLGCRPGLLHQDQVVAKQSRLDGNAVSGYKAIVFLDDISGSGFTLWGTMTSFFERFHKIITDGQRHLFYSCIVPGKKGIKHIERQCRKNGIAVKGLYLQEWLQKPAFEKNSKPYQEICPYENMVGNYLTGEDKSFFMGFRQNRLLVSFYYNTPNNTLSTFWRFTPYLLPPFERSGNQPLSRPNIEAMKSKSRQMRTGAYRFRSDQRSQKNGS